MTRHGLTHRIARMVATPAALLTAGVLLASAYGGCVDPARSHWPAMLTLAMPPVMAAAAVVTVALALARRWTGVAVMAATWLLSWPSLGNLSPLNLVGNPHESDSTLVFKVMTYNVCSFRRLRDNEVATMRYILDRNPDVVVLQEGRLKAGGIEQLPTVKPYLDEINAKYPYRSTGYHDLTLMSKVPYSVHEDSMLVHGDIHSLEYHYYAKMFDLTVKGRPLRIINLHLQSIGLTDSDKQLYGDLTRLNNIDSRGRMLTVKRSLLDKVGAACRRRAAEARLVRRSIDESPANLIVCGDFNDTPSSFTYRTLRGDDLEDAWARCGRGPTYTYNAHRLLFKIDHMLYRGDMEAIDIAADKAGNSDHYPLMATFRWNKP